MVIFAYVLFRGPHYQPCMKRDRFLLGPRLLHGPCDIGALIFRIGLL